MNGNLDDIDPRSLLTFESTESELLLPSILNSTEQEQLNELNRNVDLPSLLQTSNLLNSTTTSSPFEFPIVTSDIGRRAISEIISYRRAAESSTNQTISSRRSQRKASSINTNNTNIINTNTLEYLDAARGSNGVFLTDFCK